MDRAAWLSKQRRLTEEQDDTIYAPIYDEKWGAIDPTHDQFLHRFLGLCPPRVSSWTPRVARASIGS
jgi:hypothetical protein